MKQITDLVQNLFLFALLIGLFSLPIVVSISLNPVVDNEPVKANLQTDTAKDRAEYVRKTEDKNANKNQNVLGTTTDSQEFQLTFVGGVRVRTERILNSEPTSYSSIFTIDADNLDESIIDDGLYLIENRSDSDSTLQLKFSGNVGSLQDSKIYVMLDQDTFQIYDGEAFKMIPAIVLPANAKSLLSIKVVTDSTSNLSTTDIIFNADLI